MLSRVFFLNENEFSYHSSLCASISNSSIPSQISPPFSFMLNIRNSPSITLLSTLVQTSTGVSSINTPSLTIDLLLDPSYVSVNSLLNPNPTSKPTQVNAPSLSAHPIYD